MADSVRQKIINAIDAQFKLIREFGFGEGPFGEGFFGGDMGDSIRQKIINAIDARLKAIP